uniref:HAT C-terminal dimerisation domain-containing protein n=1 Tax=Latimeria chalumnae TaxID=7897 RepID=H3ANF7_LATCH
IVTSLCNLGGKQYTQQTTKCTSLRKRWRQNVPNGGAIPSSTQLRCEYLPKVAECHKQEIMELVNLSVVTDESTDAQDQYVLHILFVLQGLNDEDASDSKLKAVLADIMYLQAVNYNTISQAIVKCLNNVGVDFNNISAFISDSATYMSKAYNQVLQGLLSNSVHLTCNAHIVALLELKCQLDNSEILQIQLNLIARHGKELVDLIKWFENREVHVHQAYNKVVNLINTYKALTGEQHSGDTGIQSQCIKTFTEIADKLTNYYDPNHSERTSHFTQPAHQFLKAVRMFDPLQVCMLNLDALLLDSMLGFNRSCKTELEGYRFYAKECSSDLSLTAFWRSAEPRFPNIANLANRYLSVVPNSMDAERSV